MSKVSATGGTFNFVFCLWFSRPFRDWAGDFKTATSNAYGEPWIWLVKSIPAGLIKQFMKYTNLTPIPVIDSHVHIFPPKLFAALKNWFETYAWHFFEDGEAEEFITRQFEAGISGLVLLPFAHKSDMSVSLNRFTASLTRRFAGTVGLAAVHPRDQNLRDVLKQAFEEYGLAGVKMHCHVMGVAPDDPSMFPIYETVLKYNKVITIHAGREPAIDAYGLDVRAITGATRVEKVLRQYPDIKMIIPHLGIDETSSFCKLLDRYPNLYLDTAMVIGEFFLIDLNIDLLRKYSGRILFGTDYPHIPYERERELKSLLSFPLNGGAIHNILYKNAANLWNDFAKLAEGHQDSTSAG